MGRVYLNHNNETTLKETNPRPKLELSLVLSVVKGEHRDYI